MKGTPRNGRARGVRAPCVPPRFRSGAGAAEPLSLAAAPSSRVVCAFLSRRLASAGAPRVLRVAAAPRHCRPRPFGVWETGRLTAKGPRLRSLLFALSFRSATTRRSEKPTAKAAAKRCRYACGSFALASYHNPLHPVKVKPKGAAQP